MKYCLMMCFGNSSHSIIMSIKITKSDPTLIKIGFKDSDMYDILNYKLDKNAGAMNILAISIPMLNGLVPIQSKHY